MLFPAAANFRERAFFVLVQIGNCGKPMLSKTYPLLPFLFFQITKLLNYQTTLSDCLRGKRLETYEVEALPR